MNDYVKFSSAALTPILALLTAYIAFRQWRTNHLKLRHELYERRLSVYVAVMEFLAYVMQRASLNDEELRNFLKKTRESYFLFGKDIGKYLDELYKKAVDLQALSSELESLPVGEERSRKVLEKGEISKWFSRQFDVTRTKFSKYMRLT